MTQKTREKRRRYSRGWRAQNQERAYKYQQAYNQRRTKSRQELLHREKDKPCTDCGRRYPYYVMDFDHVRGQKLLNVGQGLSQSLARLKQEIAKCEVVCANCHRERTHQRKLVSQQGG